jgi:hypothetical protein
VKAPLSKMLAIFSGRGRDEKTNAIQDRYCACGALKPEVVRPEREPSFKIQGHNSGLSENDQLASTGVIDGPSSGLSNNSTKLI